MSSPPSPTPHWVWHTLNSDGMKHPEENEGAVRELLELTITECYYSILQL